jgi:hypothetical protein
MCLQTGKGWVRCCWTSGKLISQRHGWLLTRRQNKWSIKVLVALIMVACYHNSLRVRSYLLQAALVPPFLSPWRKLYDEGDSSSFLHVTGLTWEAFDSLLYVVIPPGHTMRRRRRGRPWSLPPDGMLGLLLCYLGSQMTIKWLRFIFGITPTPCSHILKKYLYECEVVTLSSACKN